MTCQGCGHTIQPGSVTYRQVVGFKPSKGSGMKIVKWHDGEFCRGCVEAMAGAHQPWEQLSMF